MATDMCDCSLLAFDDSQVSSWSDFSNRILLTSNVKRRSPTRAKSYATSNCGSRCGFSGMRNGEFKHHEDYHAYIEEYRSSQHKVPRNQRSNMSVFTAPYNTTYNLHLPIYREHWKTTLKQQPVERESSGNVDNCPESSYRIQNSATSFRKNQMCLKNKREDDSECGFYKQRDLSEISLTGKFVKRMSTSKSMNSLKHDVAPRRPTLDQSKLPHPQNPLLTCNYKLPATFPSKVADRTRYHTAKTKSEKLLKHHQTMSKSLCNTPCNNWQTGRRLLNFDLDKPSKVGRFNCTMLKGGSGSAAASRISSAKYSTGSKVDHNRQKQLQQLVEMLGETSLSPYLRKLTMKQTSFAPSLVNDEAIDYSVIFGSRI